MTTAWGRFEQKNRELTDLIAAIKLLHWDQAALMPPKGAAGRARAMSTLESMAHARLVEPEMGDLLDQLAGDESLDERQRASVRVLKHDYDKATRVPPELVREIAEARGNAYQAWVDARPASDYEMLRPHLEKLVVLRKREVDAIGYDGERYDALLDDYEPQMKTAEVEKMFDDLAAELKPVAEKVLAAVGEEPEFTKRSFDPETQERFCAWLVKQVGFDLDAGRLDTSPHPFTTMVGAGDVRQTIRSEPDQIFASIYAALHETGHALYEQGLPGELLDLPVGRAPSLGMHESQSRMWENHVGRSREFTAFLLPHLRDHFPNEMDGVTPEEFYEGANHPKRSLIRVYADEVTYNLHLVLRFQLELALFRDEITVADLPGLWNEKSKEHIGIRPDNHGDGVLQDMHWSIGSFGYFPTYTLGTLYAAAFYEKAHEELNLSSDLERGDGSALHKWLNENVYSYAYTLSAKELAEKIIGAPLTVQPFVTYIKTKYGDLYDVSF